MGLRVLKRWKHGRKHFIELPSKGNNVVPLLVALITLTQIVSARFVVCIFVKNILLIT
jgi:hypothetical protein